VPLLGPGDRRGTLVRDCSAGLTHLEAGRGGQQVAFATWTRRGRVPTTHETMEGFLGTQPADKAVRLPIFTASGVLPSPRHSWPGQEPAPRRHLHPAPTAQAAPRGLCGRPLGDTQALSSAAASPHGSALSLLHRGALHRRHQAKGHRRNCHLSDPGLSSAPMGAAATRLHRTHRQDLCLKRHPGARCTGSRTLTACANAMQWDSYGWHASYPTRHQSPGTALRTSAL